MMLNEGDLVVVLSNRKLELEIAQQKTQCDKLLAELNALQKLRTVASDDSAKVATLQEQRKDAQERLELLQADMQRLSMRASRASRVYSPPEVRMTSFRETDVRAWTGTLLDPANAGVSLRKGTWICMLGDAVKREAVLVVPSSDIEAVRPGQSVTLRLAGWPSGSVRGKVALVSESPMSGGGEEWIPDSLRKNQAPATAYRVLVTIDEGSPALQVRMVGRASIRVQARSLWWRATRTFWDWFG
jgi:putative peptide zinc metalloprotease protein